MKALLLLAAIHVLIIYQSEKKRQARKERLEHPNNIAVQKPADNTDILMASSKPATMYYYSPILWARYR